MRNANRILVDYFDSLAHDSGLEAARDGVRAVVVKGVELVLATPDTRSRNVRLVLEAACAGRTDQLVTGVVADIQDGYKALHPEMWLRAIELDGVRYPFPGDVFLPAEPSTARAWTEFLASLEPPARTARDPQTGLPGRIPFRQGVWWADLILAPGRPLITPRELRMVRGDLVMDSEACQPAEPLAVKGSLSVPLGLVRSRPCRIARLGGHLNLSRSSHVDDPADLTLSPDDLAAWGLVPGHRLTAGGRTYRLLVEDDSTRLQEADTAEPRSWRWQDGGWRPQPLPGSDPLSLAVAEAIAAMVPALGLPERLLPAADPAGPSAALSTLARFAELYATPEAQLPTGPPATEGMTRLAAWLDELAALLPADPDSEEAIRGVALARRITTNAEQVAAWAIPGPPLGTGRLAADTAFLEKVLHQAITVADLLPLPGRALVFLNNIFVSKPARQAAAARAAHVRKALRACTDKTLAERLLVELLKAPPEEQQRLADQSLPDCDAAGLEPLRAALDALNTQDPRRLITELARQLAAFRQEDPQVEPDLRLVEHLAGPPEEDDLDSLLDLSQVAGRHAFEPDVTRMALWVNLRSQLRRTLSAQHAATAGSPKALAADLLARARSLAPLMAAYNARAKAIR